MSSEPLVSCRVTDAIAQVRLERPAKLNGLTMPLLRQLASTAADLRRRKDVRAVVLSGAGECFSAGLDFASVTKDPKAMPLGLLPRPWRRDGTNTFQQACWAWRSVPVPVIAAVEGYCFGGGLQLALGADFRITAPDAQWSVMEAKWGLVPDMTGVQSLRELVGIELAKRLSMTAERFTGSQAHEWGLAGRVSDQPVEAALEFARELTQRSPDQLAATKKLFDTTGSLSPRRTFARERWAQIKLIAGPNAAIARKAGLAKEAPVFVDRRSR